MPKTTDKLGLKTFEELEQSLLQLSLQYASEPDQRRQLRDTVIRAKDRARFAAKNTKAAPEKRAVKAEMVEWMLVWLGDPAMFPAWIRIRRSRIF